MKLRSKLAQQQMPSYGKRAHRSQVDYQTRNFIFLKDFPQTSYSYADGEGAKKRHDTFSENPVSDNVNIAF